jgi:phospholipid N-methyltransferase
MARHKLHDSLHFLGTFVRSPATVGALLPSSRYLAQELVQDLELGAGDVVVEYGPGTGPITQVLEPLLDDGARYLGIEREPGFCARLRERFPRLDFHLGSVEHVARILEQRGLARPRVIVSGLPFASLPDRVQKRVIIATRRVLDPEGEFRTFQYVHAYGLPAAQRFRRAMRQKFGAFERSQPVLRNVPPAYVLRYRV